MAAKSDVGVLTVYMDAVTDQFHAGLQGAEKAIKSFRGHIKGLNRTFTEVKNKVAVVSGVLESAFKGISAFAKAIKGDMGAARDVVESLPLGIGAAVASYNEMLGIVTGSAEEHAKIEASLKRSEEYQERLTKQTKEQAAAIKSVEAAAISIAHQTSVLVEGMEKGPKAAAALQRDLARAAEVAPIDEELRKAEESVRHALAGGAGSAAAGSKHAIILGQRRELVASLEKELEETNKLHDTLEALVVEEEHRALIARVVADGLKDQADNARELLKAQNALTSAQKTRDKIAGRGLQGAANTFTSPMGTISLPALNTTAELAREQLAELRTIEQTITGLETTIKDLTKP